MSQIYEYKVVYLFDNTGSKITSNNNEIFCPELTKQINQYANIGWELVSVIQPNNSHYSKCFFKRLKTLNS